MNLYSKAHIERSNIQNGSSLRIRRNNDSSRHRRRLITNQSVNSTENLQNQALDNESKRKESINSKIFKDVNSSARRVQNGSSLGKTNESSKQRGQFTTNENLKSMVNLHNEALGKVTKRKESIKNKTFKDMKSNIRKSHLFGGKPLPHFNSGPKNRGNIQFAKVKDSSRERKKIINVRIASLILL